MLFVAYDVVFSPCLVVVIKVLHLVDLGPSRHSGKMKKRAVKIVMMRVKHFTQEEVNQGTYILMHG